MFVSFTRTGTGAPVYINLSLVRAFTEADGGTLIWFDDEHKLGITESPSDLVAAMTTEMRSQITRR
jgi:hypothetical protein